MSCPSARVPGPGQVEPGRGKDTFGSGALPRCQEDTLFLWSQPDVLDHAGRKEGNPPQAEKRWFKARWFMSPASPEGGNGVPSLSSSPPVPRGW